MTMFPVTTKTAAYTLAGGDDGTEIQFNATSAVTCSLPQSSTMTNGFHAVIHNVSEHDLTVLPYGSETIDDRDSMVLPKNHRCWVGCDATTFRILGRFPDEFEFMNAVTETSDKTLTVADAGTLTMLDSSTPKTFTLPSVSASGRRGNVYAFKNIGEGRLTVGGAGNDLIDTSSGLILEQDRSVMLIGDKENDRWRSVSIYGSSEGIYSADNFFEDLVDLGLGTGLELVLDVGAIESFPGTGQDWYDLTSNNNDFYLGVNGSNGSDDPTFNGTAGRLGIDEYFSYDGGDKHRLQAGNTTFTNGLHQDSATWTMIAVLQIPNITTDLKPIFSTGAEVNKPGTLVDVTPSEKLRFVQAASAFHQINISTAAVPIDEPVFVGLSVDEDGGANGSFWRINGTQETFDGAYTSPSGADASQPFELFGDVVHSRFMQSGGKLWAFAMWSYALTNSELDDVWDQVQSRFGL